MTAHWLVIAPRNAPIGSGRFVFLPEAKRLRDFLARRGSPSALATFDVTDTKIARRLDVLEQASKFGPTHYQHAAVCCHGWETGLQCGLLAADWPSLLAPGGPPHGITLYACSAGEGPGVGGEDGYADRVRTEMHRADLRGHVLAHRTKGHATTNPTLALFRSEALNDGGKPIVGDFAAPAWRRWLKQDEHRFELAVDPDPARWGYAA